ncbi:hypothetical protein IKG28_03350 [Candidatus Saccharibacteria bacterium]|nr:hypothetical protein [Candidatus Saccharibacteria bacterium]
MKDEMVLVKFEEMLDSFDENDEICVEDVQAEMHKHWKHFVDAGCDATQAAKMMAPMEVYKNYEYLVSKNAQIDIDNLFLRLIDSPDATDDFTTNVFFTENYKWFFKRGANPKTFIEGLRYEEDKCRFIMENCEELCSRGIDKEYLSNILVDSWCELASLSDKDFIAEYAKKGFDAKILVRKGVAVEDDFRWNFEENALEYCTLLFENGASTADIEEILDIIEYDFYFDLEFKRSRWKEIGIDCTESKYIERYLDYVLGYEEVDDVMCQNQNSYPNDLMAKISEVLLRKLSMKEIMERHTDPEYFIGSCVYDTKAFGKKFVDEIGYKVDNNCIDWMYCILLADKDALDVNKVVDCILAQEDEKSRLDYIEYLKDLGIEVKTA